MGVELRSRKLRTGLEFSRLVTNKINDNNLTLEEVAYMAGLSASTIGNITCGYVPKSLKVVSCICYALEIPLAEGLLLATKQLEEMLKIRYDLLETISSYKRQEK